jgi:hypothetical protein
MGEFIHKIEPIGDKAEIEGHQTIEGFKESVIKHAANQPFVILVLTRDEELSELLKFNAILQRFDLVLLLSSDLPGLKSKSNKFRPRLVLGIDEDPEWLGLLVKAALEKWINEDKGIDGRRSYAVKER